MNLVSLLIATSVVRYSHNLGLRAGVSIAAIAIIVGAVLVAKRRASRRPGRHGRAGRAGRGDRRPGDERGRRCRRPRGGGDRRRGDTAGKASAETTTA